MFERKEAWNRAEFKELPPSAVREQVACGQAGRILNGSCILPQTIANGRRVLSKVFCHHAAFWTSMVTIFCKSFSQNSTEAFSDWHDISLSTFHIVDSQDFAIHLALYRVTSSPFPNWMSFLIVSMATPHASSRPNLNKHNFPCDIFSPKHSHPSFLHAPRIQTTEHHCSAFQSLLTSLCLPLD